MFIFSCIFLTFVHAPLFSIQWVGKVRQVNVDSMDVIDEGEGGMYEGIYVFAATQFYDSMFKLDSLLCFLYHVCSCEFIDNV